MSQRKVSVGQVWRSRDGGSLFKVREVDETGTLAHGSSPDGKKPRSVQVKRLLSGGRNGYVLEEDVP